MTKIRIFGKDFKAIRLFGEWLTVALEKEQEPGLMLQEEQEPGLMLQEEQEPGLMLQEEQEAGQILQEEQEEGVIQRDSPLPNNMYEAIQLAGGSEPVYIGRKKVEQSDIKSALSRFFIPTGTCNANILNNLNSEERKKLENQHSERSLEVRVMDPKGNIHKMKFTRWLSLNQLVLNHGWNKLVKANDLQKGDTIDLWHFRISSEPYFAMNIIKNQN